MFSKMPKPIYRVLLGLFFISLVAVACNNKKKEADKPAEETPKENTAPTPPSVNDSLGTNDTDKPVVPDH
jgi:hypothetical protein